MFVRALPWIWLVSLVVLFAAPAAHAADRLELPDLTELPEAYDPEAYDPAEAPPRLDLPDPPRPVRYSDMARYDAARGRLRTGPVLIAIGLGTVGLGVGLSYLGACNPYGCILGLGALGIGVGVVGIGVSIPGALANPEVEAASPSRTASRRGFALALAPTFVAGAPGLAIAARW